jgi:hypothetical protein
MHLQELGKKYFYMSIKLRFYNPLQYGETGYNLQPTVKQY